VSSGVTFYSSIGGGPAGVQGVYFQLAIMNSIKIASSKAPPQLLSHIVVT